MTRDGLMVERVMLDIKRVVLRVARA